LEAPSIVMRGSFSRAFKSRKKIEDYDYATTRPIRWSQFRGTARGEN
jgi:hypothetical protein